MITPEPRRVTNLPLDYVHDPICGFGYLLNPVKKAPRGRQWLMWSKTHKRLERTYLGGFHNCTATGVK